MALNNNIIKLPGSTSRNSFSWSKHTNDRSHDGTPTANFQIAVKKILLNLTKQRCPSRENRQLRNLSPPRRAIAYYNITSQFPHD